MNNFPRPIGKGSSAPIIARWQRRNSARKKNTATGRNAPGPIEWECGGNSKTTKAAPDGAAVFVFIPAAISYPIRPQITAFSAVLTGFFRTLSMYRPAADRPNLSRFCRAYNGVNKKKLTSLTSGPPSIGCTRISLGGGISPNNNVHT